MDSVICNKCGELFFPAEQRPQQIEAGDLQVQFFECPYCLAKYQVITTDPKMRELIAARQSWQQQIRLAQGKHFRQSTIERYEREIEKIKAQQKKLLPALKRRGAEVLRATEEDSHDEKEKA